MVRIRLKYKYALIHKNIKTAASSQTEAMFFKGPLTSSSGSKVMVSMSTGDSSLPLKREEVSQTRNWSEFALVGIVSLKIWFGVKN